MSAATEARGLLAGKVVLITGAGGGIGRETARLAAHEGACVVVNDLGAAVDGGGRDTSRAAETVELILSEGGKAVADDGDVTDANDARAMVDRAVQEFGRLDGVVNNAGNFRVGSMETVSQADIESHLRIHVLGSFLVSQAAMPQLMRHGNGSFVHTTSSSGLIGSRGAMAYAVAKGGIVALSRSIALDLATHGIRSNCVAPSAASRMSSASAKKADSGAGRAAAIAASQPAQMAPLAIFLLSDEARDFSGQVIGARGNEVYLYNQPRPVRTLHDCRGFTPAKLAAILPGAWNRALVPLESFVDVFSWPPI